MSTVVSRKSPSGPASIVYEEVSVDFGAINPSTVASQTLSVPGVNVGDVVMANPQQAIDDRLVMRFPFIPADDQVTIQVRNSGPGVVDPAVITWDLAIIKSGAA